jgi:hypothetical protein
MERRLTSSLGLAASVLVGAACIPSQLALIPADPDSSSVVLVVLADSPRIYAYNLRNASSFDLALDLDPHATEVYALVYRCPLPALGLEPGPQSVDTRSGSKIPPESKRYLFDPSAGRFNLSTGPRPQAMENIRIASSKPNPCATLNRTEVPLSGSVNTVGQFLLPLDERRTLASLLDMGAGLFELFLLTRTATSIVVTSLPLARETLAHAAYLDPSGSIWLFGSAGELSMGSLEDGFSRTSTVPLEGEVADVWVSGASSAAPLEIYVVANSGSISRFDGAKWSAIHGAVPCLPARSCFLGAVLWQSPEDVLAGFPGVVGLERYVNSARVPVPVEAFGGQPVNALARLSSGEVFATTRALKDAVTFGFILVSSDGGASWQGEQATSDVRFLTAAGERLFLTDRTGVIVEREPGPIQVGGRTSLCPQLDPEGTVDAAAFTQGGELVFLVRQPAPSRTVAAYVTLTAPTSAGCPPE